MTPMDKTQELLESMKPLTPDEVALMDRRLIAYRLNLKERALSGEPSAIKALLDTADFAIRALAEVEKKSPKPVQSLADHRTDWPVHGRPTGMKLGGALPYRISAKTKVNDPEGVMARITLNHLLGMIQDKSPQTLSLLKEFGPLNRQNWKHYRKIASDYMVQKWAPPTIRWKHFRPEWKEDLRIVILEGLFEPWFADYSSKNKLSLRKKSQERKRIHREHSSSFQYAASSISSAWYEDALQVLANHEGVKNRRNWENVKNRNATEWQALMDSVLAKVSALLKNP